MGRPIQLFLTAGNVSDYIGARALLALLPSADWMLADRGYDGDWFREGLKERCIKPCIPSRRNRKGIIPHDNKIYRSHHKIENMFGRLKGLAQGRDPLRQMPHNLSVCHRPRGNGIVLVMSPDPELSLILAIG